jgi:CBS domain-containing protein
MPGGLADARVEEVIRMKVKDIMTRDVGFCVPEDKLRDVARIMEGKDCGCVPVIDARKITGMITDRDICLHLVESNSRASQVTAGEVMSRAVYSCQEDDEIGEALETMRARKIRRLPVTDGKGALHGILSLNDVALHSAERGNERAVPWRETMKTLQAVCEHRRLGPAPPAKMRRAEARQEVRRPL